MRRRKTYGTLKRTRKGDKWTMAAEPHVIQMAKRIWRRGGRVTGKINLLATPQAAVDLDWFMGKYPLEMSSADMRHLKVTAGAHTESIRRVQDYLGKHIPPPDFDMALPPRDYQAREAAILLAQGHLLVADQLGLGKTCSSIAPMTDSRALPAIVVTMTHLPHQWAAELKKFAPHLRTHVIRVGKLYPLFRTGDEQLSLPGHVPDGPPDVVILSYSKLAKWAQVLGAYGKYVVFDEVQELRVRKDGRGVPSQKYAAACHLASKMQFRMGLSATPIYNYGDEIFAVLDVLAPKSLGTWTEFSTEWCQPVGNRHYKIKEPSAFGSWAREQGLIVRHTRKDVGRELPDVITIVQEIGAEAKQLDKIDDRATELAQILLDGAKRARGESLMAGGELDKIVRQATGLAKAPYVAEFVRLLVESGESVLLAGWHHAVYDLWESRLSAAGIEPVRYTGEESPVQKQRSAEMFMNGQAKVMMISLRSGAGLDGLQTAAKVVVFGELDWSPKVQDQVIGRLNRDGQLDPVVAYYLIADSGSDPLMCEALGVKRQQAAGVVELGEAPTGALLAGEAQDRGRRLAKEWMRRTAA